MKDPSIEALPKRSSSTVNGQGIFKIIRQDINATPAQCTILNFLLFKIKPMGKPKTI